MFAQSVCMNVVNGINVSTLKYLTLFSSLSRLDSTIDGFFYICFVLSTCNQPIRLFFRLPWNFVWFFQGQYMIFFLYVSALCVISVRVSLFTFIFMCIFLSHNMCFFIYNLFLSSLLLFIVIVTVASRIISWVGLS